VGRQGDEGERGREGEGEKIDYLSPEFWLLNY
jgi:hypothetical protein